MDVWVCGVPELCFGRGWLVSSCASAAPEVIDVDDVIEQWAGGKEVFHPPPHFYIFYPFYPLPVGTSTRSGAPELPEYGGCVPHPTRR